jgi:polyhydroxybutyrate depolymerase
MHRRTFLAGTLAIATPTFAAGNLSAVVGGSMSRLPLQWQGVERFYNVHRPTKYVAGNGGVFVLHGGGGDWQRIADASEMSASADAQGFLAVFPEGGGDQWNDGRENVDANKDDIGFIEAVALDLNSRMGLRLSKMALCGASNGGLMTQRVARERPGLFAAYASVIANYAAAIAGTPAAAPVPMMMFNGTADRLMPWAGGVIPGGNDGGNGGGLVISTMATVEAWAATNQATGVAETLLPNVAPLDGCRVYRRVYTGGLKPLTLYRVENGGHTWPGSDEATSPIAGRTTKDISATKLMVQFFREQGV